MSFKIRAVNENLEEFYAGSSVFVPNKFMVYLDGPYLTRAIDNMEQLVTSNSREYPIDANNFFKWKAAHVEHTDKPDFTRRESPEGIKNRNYGDFKFQSVGDSIRNSALSNDNYGDYDFQRGKGGQGKAKFQQLGYKLKFLWACKDVSIPLVDIGTDIDESQGLRLDSIRNLKYTIVTKYSMDQEIDMTIIEQKGMIWYHFFNELGNVFFDAKLMTPRDSVRKLRMRIDTLLMQDQGAGDASTAYVNAASAYELGQQFEFNNVVYTGGNNLDFSQDTETPMEHSVKFKIANPFQKSFKHDFAGLKNQLHDDGFVIENAVDPTSYECGAGTLNAISQYEEFLNDDSRADD